MRGSRRTPRSPREGRVHGTWGATLPLASVNALAADLGARALLDGSYTGTLVAEGEIAGDASSPEASARLRGDDLAARGHPHSLDAQARYAAGRVELSPLLLRSGRGQATIAGSVPVLADAGEWDLGGEIEALDLAPVFALAGLEGDGPASGTLRVEGPRDAPRGRVALDASVLLDEPDGRAAEPVAVSLAAASEGSRVDVERFTAETAGGQVEGSGRYDRETGSIEAKARATGLAWARLPLLPPSLRRLGGTLAADLTLGGTTSAPTGEAHATLETATLDGAALPGLAFDASADGRQLKVGGRAGDASFLKGTGELQGDWPARFEVDTAALPAQALFDALTARKQPGATLEVRGTVVVELALRDARQVRYAAQDLAAGGRVGRVEWSTDPFRLEGTAEEASVSGLRLTTRALERNGSAARPAAAAGTLSVDGHVPFAEGRAYDLTLKGDFTLGALEALAPESQATGRRLDRGARGRHLRRPRHRGHLRPRGRRRAGRGRADQPGAGQGPLPGP